MLKKATITCVMLILMNALDIAQERVRIFVTDSQSWETKGSAGITDASGGAHFSGGARPQNAEIAKTFRERCPNLTVTNIRDKADFIITIDHEGGKNLIQKDNKWVVYNREGDMIGAGSTRSLGNSVRNACTIVTNEGGTKH